MSTFVGKNKFYRPSDFEGIKEDRSNDGEIKDLSCPDCDSQAFKTDKPGVAVCGDCPGWYFYYEHDEVQGKKQYTVKIVNGDMVYKPKWKTTKITNHP